MGFILSFLFYCDWCFYFYLCIYNYNVITMKNKKKKILYHFRIHSELLEFIRTVANNEFTTVTQYLLDLITKDINNRNKITSIDNSYENITQP